MFDELFFLYDTFKIKNISYLEDFIYRYIYLYKNCNSVDKIILLYNSKDKIKLHYDLLNKLENPKIFYENEIINNKNFFHVTHNKIINYNDKLLFDHLINSFSNIRIKKYNDLNCDYSITFLIKFI